MISCEQRHISSMCDFQGKLGVRGGGAAVLNGATGRDGTNGGVPCGGDPASATASAVDVVAERLRLAQSRLGELRERQRRVAELGGSGAEEHEVVGRVLAQEAVVVELEEVCGLIRSTKREGAGTQGLHGAKAAKAAKVSKASDEADVSTDQVVARRVGEAVRMVVQLMYCASLFDPFVPYQVEKAAMLAWMHRTRDVRFQMELPRFAEMLDAIGVLGKMMTRRPLGEGKSHSESVQYCQEVALRYVLGGEDSVLGWSGFMTKGQVQGALREVMQSEYFTRDGLMYGGGGEGMHREGEGQWGGVQDREGQPASQGEERVGKFPIDACGNETSGEYEKCGEHGVGTKVSTPSLAQDHVGISVGGNESADGSSDGAEVSEVDGGSEIDLEPVGRGVFGQGGPDGVGAEGDSANAAETVDVAGSGEATGGKIKRKSSGGKWKGKNKGKNGKGQMRAGSPAQADRGVELERADHGVIETSHKVLPQRAQKKKNAKR